MDAVLYCVAQIPPLELEDLFLQVLGRLADSYNFLDEEATSSKVMLRSQDSSQPKTHLCGGIKVRTSCSTWDNSEGTTASELSMVSHEDTIL